MKNSDEIRNSVSTAYAKAVNNKQNQGCCGEVKTKGLAARLAGYSKEDIRTVPVEAYENSFGCGNPLAFSGVREGDVVLDLGSGAGLDLVIASERVGRTGRVIGIDMTDDMIKKAEENIRASGKENIEVRKGIIEELPVESESVDWVISNCVINLSPEKEKVFSEIQRVLRPGGKMLISDIVADDMPEWVIKSMALYNSCVSGAVSESLYLSLIKKAGLKNVAVVERFDYSSSQIIDIARTETDLNELLDDISAASDNGSGLKQLFESLEGKIASVKVFAEKSI